MKPVVVGYSKKKKNLYKLHHISQKWIAELEFMFDEQRFLQDLLSTFFIDLCSVELFPDTKKLDRKIIESRKIGNLLLLEIRTHDKQLATLLESIHFDGECTFRTEQKKLANKFDQFVQSNKLLKTRVFTIIKHIMKQHKQKLLLSHVNSQEEDNPTL